MSLYCILYDGHRFSNTTFNLILGASVEVSETKIQANPLLHSAIQSDSCYKLQVVKLLLEKGCDSNGRRLGNLDTPAHISAKHGHLDILKVGAQIINSREAIP